ncbi:MAG: response regulator, partial [Chromatiaceae bacterium]
PERQPLPDGPNAVSALPMPRGAHILIAEDNEIAAKVIGTLLSKQGFNVTRVRDGEEALSHAREGSFAVALIDLRMPKIDGIEFTRAYRGSEQPGEHLPIVALTADAAEGARAQCLAAGMDDFLAKPVKPDELTEIVRHYATAPIAAS